MIAKDVFWGPLAGLFVAVLILVVLLTAEQ